LQNKTNKQAFNYTLHHKYYNGNISSILSLIIIAMALAQSPANTN